MYVDESGDPGMVLSSKSGPSRHYILTGFTFSASLWAKYLNTLVQIRKDCNRLFGYPLRRELKGSELIHPRDQKIQALIPTRKKRIELYKYFLESIVTGMPESRIILIHVNKAQPMSLTISSTSDIERHAWEFLIQRYHTQLTRDYGGDLGMIFADDTNEKKIRGILRKMRVYNPIPSKYGGSYNAVVGKIVEDPVLRDSKHSYFIQIADLICYSLYQKLYPKGSLRRFNVNRLFDIVDPILNKAASAADPQGIVHI